MTFNLVEILKTLADRRPIFHSEADFQHALAWIIHEQHPDLAVRLEKRLGTQEPRAYIDIWVEHNGAIYAIELKYKTKLLQFEVGDELFDLRDQSAQDLGRYDFCKDLQRIETLADAYPDMSGFAVFLTNDHVYWQERARGDQADRAFRLHEGAKRHRQQQRSGVKPADGAFRLHEGAKLAGKLKWKSGVSSGTTTGRTDAICLKQQYSLKWMDYSKCGPETNSQFRMLIVSIGPSTHAPAETTKS